jgi:hypothetical protein
MCEVCAIFGAGEHWSDFGRMRDERYPFDGIQHYRDERKRRIQLLNLVLKEVDVSCEDWDGEALMLYDKAGRSKIALTLNDVWPAAESLSGRCIDPLDPSFMRGADLV